MTRTHRCTFGRLALMGGLVATTAGWLASAASAQNAPAGFTTYENDKHGFSVIYSSNQFKALPATTPDGFQAVSKDGKARLLAGTIGNRDGRSLGGYRNFLLTEVYAGASIDYAPVRDTWFVLSGVKADGTTAFYQRVNFLCGGRNINSWAVLFQARDEPVYSKIIEQLHRDYVAGDGNCAKVTMMEPTPQSKQMAGMEPVMPPTQMPAATEPAMAPKQIAPKEPAVPAKQMVVAVEAAKPAKQMGAMDTAMPPRRMATMDLATYANDKHGFALTYPTGKLLALPHATPDGFQAVSRDGKARLLAGTLANFDGKTLGAYRSFLLAQAYPDAKLDDAPDVANGFVLAGVQRDGTTAFYHRVSFVCGGSNINSWSTIYPSAEKTTYAPIIEQVSKDYRLGDGNCAKMTMMQSK